MRKKNRLAISISFLLIFITQVVLGQDVFVGDENPDFSTSEDVIVPEPQINRFLTEKDIQDKPDQIIKFTPDFVSVKQGETFLVRVSVNTQTLITFPSAIKGVINVNNNDAFLLSWNKRQSSLSKDIANQLFITAIYPNQQLSASINTEKGNYNLVAISLAVSSPSTPNLVIFVKDEDPLPATIDNFSSSLSSSNNNYNGSEDIKTETDQIIKNLQSLHPRLNPVGGDLDQYLNNIKSLTPSQYALAFKSGVFNDNYLIVGAEGRKYEVFDDNIFTIIKIGDDPYRVNFGEEINAILTETADFSYPVTDFQVIRNYIVIKHVSEILKIVVNSNLPDNKPPKVICIIRNKDNKYTLINEFN